MKLLVDMNLSPRWAQFLADAGWRAVHWSSLVKSTATDAELMAEHDYVVLTFDLDFSAILSATKGNKPRVIQIRTDDVSPAVIGARVAAAMPRPV